MGDRSVPLTSASGCASAASLAVSAWVSFVACATLCLCMHCRLAAGWLLAGLHGPQTGAGSQVEDFLAWTVNHTDVKHWGETKATNPRFFDGSPPELSLGDEVEEVVATEIRVSGNQNHVYITDVINLLMQIIHAQYIPYILLLLCSFIVRSPVLLEAWKASVVQLNRRRQ